MSEKILLSKILFLLNIYIHTYVHTWKEILLETITTTTKKFKDEKDKAKCQLRSKYLIALIKWRNLAQIENANKTTTARKAETIKDIKRSEVC